MEDNTGTHNDTVGSIEHFRQKKNALKGSIDTLTVVGKATMFCTSASFCHNRALLPYGYIWAYPGT